MNTRIYKEYRILRPFWAIALLLPLVPLMVFQDPGYCAMGYVVGCLLLGAASFGAEWNHQTMDLLLSQPLSRKRIWRDKIRMLALALGTLGLIYSMSCVALFDTIVADEGFGVLYVLIWLALPMVWALGVGPFFALRTGNSIAAFAFSVVTPFVWVVIMALLLPSGSLTGQPFAQACCVFAVPLILFAGAGYGLARFRFHHLETAGIAGGAIRPIEWLSALVKTPAVVAPADTGGALGKLIRKELRLHEVSFLITGCFVLLCALIMAYRPFYGAFAIEPFDHALLSELIMFVAFVPAVIIPMLVGAVSVAEERQIGLLEWHLTLPPSRLRQWLVKIFTAYGCSIALGILIPTALVLVSDWLCPASFEKTGVSMGELHYPGLCGISLLLTTVCLFASSLSHTGLRAILLSLGTMVLTGLTIDILRTYNVVEDLFGLAILKFHLLPILMLSIWSMKLHHFALFGVGAAVMLLMLGLGYANYRRLETRLRPAIQIVLVSLALVFLVIFTPAMLVQFGNIEKISKDTSLSGRTLLAHMRHKDPQRVVAELGLHLDNPASAPAAIATLNRYGGITPSALPLIVGGLTHPNPEVQYGATWGVRNCWTNLQNQSSLFDRARVALYQNLQNTNIKVARMTAMVLGRVDTATIIDALNGKPADSTAPLVPGAPNNLGNVIREQFVPLLVEVFESDHSHEMVIDLLGKLGPGAKQAIPALLKAAQSDRSFNTRDGAIKALEKIDPDVVRIHNLKLSPERRRGLSNGMDDAMRRRYGLGKPAPDVVRTNNLEATTNAPGQK